MTPDKIIDSMVVNKKFKTYEEAMKNVVSKSVFKPQALKYFRQIQKTGVKLIATDHSKPVLEITRLSENKK